MKNLTIYITTTSSFYLDRILRTIELEQERNEEILISCKILKMQSYENTYPEEINRYIQDGWLKIEDLTTTKDKLEPFSVASNFIIQDCKTKYLIMCNQDIQFREYSISKMLQEIENHESTGIVGPKEMNFWEGNYCFRPLVVKNNRLDWAYENEEVQAVYGFCVLFNYDCFKTIRGFNDEYGEDLLCCKRASDYGWKTRICYDAEVFHVQGSSTQEMYDTFQDRGKSKTKDPLNVFINKIDLRFEEKMKENKVTNTTIPKRLHVLGFAHTRANDDYSYCAFTTLTRLFCRMMKKEGWEIVYYGTPGSVVDCDEFVECISGADFKRNYAQNDTHKHQYIYDPNQGDGWQIFTNICKAELQRRLKNSKEIVCVGGGGYHRFVNEIPNAITLDPHIGHLYPISRYKVFAAKVWRSFYYGLKNEEMCKNQYPPYYFDDTTIYHYLDINDYEFKDEKDDYALFIGRLNQDKGIYDVMKACHEKGMRLKICGATDKNFQHEFYNALTMYEDTCEYLGTVKVKEKSDLMSNAKMVFCPSYYHEPFGLVAIESMACGTPIVTTNWGAFCETNLHGKTGYRISYYEDLLHAIEYLQDFKQENYKYIREWVEKNFDMNVASKYYNNYCERIRTKESNDILSFYNKVNHELSQDLIQP